ncbi:porin [Bradyrhizobium sp. CCGUVB14]|uniref:porin n=1 Tax=Bradyrhizobium sp. CCGUVB14 TaxID=2949628 RepID=UPI0020B3F8C2|nr:porin [Bradyrhizobium sp. CCGUVB14]MCP3444073.1 porin [Bradyrhizobium sp. CCGUVB14]
MRLSVLVLISLATTSAAGAETLRLPPTEQPQSGKTLPLKSTTGAASKANACAAYGRGFMMVEGTCVKIGGSVRVDTVTGR